MNARDLKRRLQLPEWEDLEFKAAARELPREVWRTVSAFANANGGTIVFGVRDDGKGKFAVLGVDDPEKLQNDFLSTLRGDKFNIQLSSNGRLLRLDRRTVIAFQISAMPRSCKPIYFSGDIRNTFIRRGSGDYHASREEIKRLLREGSDHSSDSMRLEGYGVEAVDSKTVRLFLRYLELRSPESPFLGLSIEALLLKLGCLRRNGRGKPALTMAGLLLFGKTDRIRDRFPAYELNLFVHHQRARKEQPTRWDDRKTFEANLIQTYLAVMNAVKERVEIPYLLRDDQMTRTEEVPFVVALREAVVNLLIHRDYFDTTQARLRVYADRIELFNPGAAPRPVEEIIANAVTAPRNPVIARVFRVAGWAEAAGSGMMKMLAALRRARAPRPAIRNDAAASLFQISFTPPRRVRAHPRWSEKDGGQKKVVSKGWSETGGTRLWSDRIRRIIELIRANPRITRAEMVIALKINPSAVQKYVSRMKTQGILRRRGSDRSGEWVVISKPNRPDKLDGSNRRASHGASRRASPGRNEA